MTTGSFPHDNFNSVYWIFTKLDHMIALWKGENSFYFGVIRSKFKVTYYKYNFWQQGRFRTITLVLFIGSLTNLATWLPCGRRRTLFILGSLPLYRLITLVSMPVKCFAPEVTETMYHSVFLLEITVVKIINNLNVCSTHSYLYPRSWLRQQSNSQINLNLLWNHLA